MPGAPPEGQKVKGFMTSSRKFIEPPLVTSNQCKMFKEGVSKELHLAHVGANKIMDGAKTLHRNNSYFGYFREPTTEPIWPEHKFTYDQVKDKTCYDQKIRADTFHSTHTEDKRRQIGVRLKTQWQIRSSQSYGWLPPLDDPKNGFGRSSIFVQSAMDRSHVTVGGKLG
eukprot:TRINITY_DN71640_c0_g1_i1.p1 TRINITY_DN71640_c0_g1~~TRINITY_DN71640_c0_g1_i1.p1  ORF type:complete len:197 (+),score=42.55 TRINITY_DN71640_c0_g1_i1:87-593(+)